MGGWTNLTSLGPDGRMWLTAEGGWKRRGRVASIQPDLKVWAIVGVVQMPQARWIHRVAARLNGLVQLLQKNACCKEPRNLFATDQWRYKRRVDSRYSAGVCCAKEDGGDGCGKSGVGHDNLHVVTTRVKSFLA
jgi:hypothetical protein